MIITDANRYQRVQIKVYRGPTNYEENYAPWGYFVRQPADF